MPENEIKFVPQRLYKQCYVMPDVERCIHCGYGHPVWFDGQEQLGWCDLTRASAYYTQLNGFCPKVAEQLNGNGRRKKKRLKPPVI